MQKNTSAARPYARAAFEQAQSDGSVDPWSKFLDLFGAVVADKGMQRIIRDPRVDQKRFLELLGDLLKPSLFPTGENFVRLLVQADRVGLAPDIAALFEQYRKDAESVVGMEVVSACELEKSQERAIQSALEKRFGKRVQITKSIDQSLIGGAIIRAGDLVFDASLRGRLRQLWRSLA